MSPLANLKLFQEAALLSFLSTHKKMSSLLGRRPCPRCGEIKWFDRVGCDQCVEVIEREFAMAKRRLEDIKRVHPCLAAPATSQQLSTGGSLSTTSSTVTLGPSALESPAEDPSTPRASKVQLVTRSDTQYYREPIVRYARAERKIEKC